MFDLGCSYYLIVVWFLQSQSRTIGWMYTALTAGYRDSWEAKWWSSFELLRRLLILGIAVVLPGRSVSVPYSV